ncbi:Large polyvalent protein associated domain-containing protein [Paraburkholderia tropica]
MLVPGQPDSADNPYEQPQLPHHFYDSYSDGPISGPSGIPNSAQTFEGAVTQLPPKVDTSEAVAGYLANTAQSARANVAVAFGANPDYEAELSRLSKETGVPIESARAYPDQVKQTAALNRIDFDALARQFPQTAAFYQDQTNARLAHDDIGGMQGVEQAVTVVGAPYGFDSAAGALSYRRRIANLLSDVSPTLGAVFAGDPLPTSSDPARQALADSLTSGPLDVFTQAAGSAGGLGLIPAPTPGGSVGDQIAGGLGSLAGFFSGPLNIGRAAVAGLSRFAPLAVDAGDSVLKAAFKSALSSGAELGTASGAGAFGQALDSSTPGGAAQTVGSATGTGAAMGAAMGALSRVLPDNNVLQATLRVAGANVLSDAITGARPWDDRPLGQKIVDYGVNSIFSLPGAGRTGGSWLHDAARAEIAAADASTLASINQAAANSKLRQRDVDAFHDFVATANEDGPIQHVYVDADVLANALNQEGVTGDQLASALPDVAQQLQLAQQTGGQVQISIPDFATQLAGKIGDQLLPHLRTDPEGMTLQEANEFRQSAADQFGQSADSMFNAAELAQAHEQSTQSVTGSVLQNLNEVNRFPAETNRTYAQLVGSFYGTMAERMGMTPEQMFASYPLRVAAEDVAAPSTMEHGTRGKLSFADDVSTAPSTITLLKNADLSTFLHESGHHFLNVLDHVARNGPDSVRADMQAVTDWFGTTPDAWRAMTLEEKRPLHEQFARGFESYLREGNAPSIEMRGVFQKMRAWLVNVYRNIAHLGVSLTPEVRGVFDRLLATNEEIKLAEASRAYAPLFRTPEEAGMTPEDYAAYQALGNEATLDAVQQLQGRTLRDLQWLENRKSEALVGVRKDVAEKRSAIEAEARTDIAAEPIYQAREFLEGEGKGADPELVAEKFGFSSADELNRKLVAAPSLDDAVEAVTDQRMLERYGDIASADGMNRAADAAIHNRARARFIATEFKALSKATGPVQELTRAAREVAERTIASRRVRDLSPAMFTAAEARAGKIAEAARIKGDIQGAARAKRDQLLNHELAKAAMDAQADIDADMRYLRKFDTPKKNGTVAPEYRKQIEQLLDQYDLRKSTTLTEIGRRKSLAEYVKQQEESTGITPDIPEHLLLDLQRTSYKDMTVEGWRGLIDAVKSIEHTGRLKQELLTAADKRGFDAFADQAAATIKEHGGAEKPTTLERNQLGDSEKGKVTQFFANHRTLGSLLQQMDGKDGGFLWDHIVRPMNERGVREASMRADATAALHEILRPVLGPHLRDKVFIPEINNSLSREGMLSIALNWGNEINQRRVMQGDGWSRAQVHAILKNLSDSDWRTVQKVWDHVDSYWPQIAAKHERVFGVEPQKVQAQEVVTPTGLRLRGGYYPIKYDTSRASRAESNEEAATLKQMLGGAYTRATTRRGFTESRLDEVKMPVRKDLGVITEHIDEVAHDLAWHEWLLDANRIFSDRRIEDAVRDHYGPEVLRTLKATLKTIAGGDLGARQTMGAAMAFMRNGVAISRLGYNLSTMLKQFAGIGPTAALIGPGYVARGASEYMGSLMRRAAVTKRVDDMSDFMRIRGRNIDRDLSTIRDQINAGKHPIIETLGKVIPVAHSLAPMSDAIGRTYLGVIEATQRQVDMVSWLGAFRKAQDEGMDQTKAVSYADQVVRDSQGSALISDRPEIMSQDKLRLWTMFYAAQNAQYNVLAKAKGQGGAAKLAYALALTAVLPSLFNVAVGELRGSSSNEDWATRLAKDFGWELAGNTLGLGVGFREIPGLLQYGYSGPSALAPLGDAARFAQQAGQGQLDEGFWRSANMLGGDVFHYPAGMLDRIGRGYMAWVNDDASPTALLFGPPSRN